MGVYFQVYNVPRLFKQSVLPIQSILLINDDVCDVKILMTIYVDLREQYKIKS